MPEGKKAHHLAKHLLNSTPFFKLKRKKVSHLQHEAGHFLVGYLLGVLPKRYKIPSMEDLVRDNYAGGIIEFVGFEFLKEVSTYPFLTTVTQPQTFLIKRM